MTRLEILKNSLERKEKKFDDKIQDHFDTVKMANGQPLNDKRNGHATLKKWEKQNDALRNLKESIEKTKSAIEKEEGKQNEKKYDYDRFPKNIKEAIDRGELVQWGKHPTILFVPGVEKGRIVVKDGLIYARYHTQIPNQEQYAIYMDTFNSLRDKLIGQCND